MSPFMRIGRVFLKAAMNNWRITSSTKSMEEESQDFNFLNTALLDPDGSEQSRNICSITDVRVANGVVKLFPIWTTCLVHGIVFAASATVFTRQALTMDRSISPRFKIPSASLNSVSSLSLAVFIFIYDQKFVPIARAITGKPSGIKVLQDFGTGIFFSVLSMVIAALIEIKRLQTAQEYKLVDKPEATIPMSVL